MAEALEQLPGVDAGISLKNSNGSVQNSGLSSVALRRLGDARTLVLINGKRAVSNSGNSDRVSLSTLPRDMIESIEVTTGGGSAVYGSDAVAGVVNFKLEDDLEGFRGYARFSTPDGSGGEEYEFRVTAGHHFNDDRGYFLLSGEYSKDEMIRANSTRPKSIEGVEFNAPTTSDANSFANEINTPGCDPNNEDKYCLLPDASGSTPGGVFEGDAWFKDGRWYNDKSLQPSDRSGSQDFLADFDGWNFRPGQTLSAERDVFNIAGHVNYEFSDALKMSLTGMYSAYVTYTASGYETLNDNDGFGFADAREIGNMASNHPFIPPEVEETRSGTVSFDRRLVELGEQGKKNDRETFRSMLEFSGFINENFAWEAYATYGSFAQRQTSYNEVNFLKAQQALDVEENNGVVQCADPDARKLGCVPINIFGEGTITKEAADWICYTAFGEQVRKQYTAGGYITGNIFELPMGDVSAVLGAEYRRESQNTKGDKDGDLVGGHDGDPTTDDVDLTSAATFPDLKASYDVFEVFGELAVPLIEDTLDLELAGRWADYSTVGSIFSYNVGLTWQVFDDLRVRGQYSRAQRAPNLTEYFSTPRPDFDSINDPCDGLRPDGTGVSQPSGVGGENTDVNVIAANCLANPGIQAYFADPDNADPVTGEINEFNGSSSIFGPNSGNPNLQEEDATTYTIGFVYRPSFVNKLGITVDYYNIRIKDAISAISSQTTIDLCYTADDFPNNKFCNVISRSQFSGDVSQIINVQENLNKQVVSGLDVDVIWDDIDLGFVPGEFDIDFRYTHYFQDKTTFTGLGGSQLVTSPLGEIDNPDDLFRLVVGYNLGRFRISYRMNFISGGVDDLVGNPNPTDNQYFAIGDKEYHNIAMRYYLDKDKKFRLTGGINNLTNSNGPLVPTGTNYGGAENIGTVSNNTAGREYYMGLVVKF